MKIEKTDFSLEFQSKEGKKFLALGRLEVLKQEVKDIEQSAKGSEDLETHEILAEKRKQIAEFEESLAKYDENWLKDLPDINNYKN